MGGVFSDRGKQELPLDSTTGGVEIDNDVLREIATILLRMSRLLESNQVVDQPGRQKICLDAVTGSLALGSVTLTSGTVTAQAGFLGMDREFFVNEARKTYNTGVRANLKWA